MPTIFLSHASKDDATASTLGVWLRANGFSDLFIDHKYIAGGGKWREALRASAGSCRVVLCLITPHWLASDECFSEFRAAWYMGKRIIPLFMTSDAEGDLRQRLSEVRAEDQGIDLAPRVSPAGALDLGGDGETAEQLRLALRSAGALMEIGLDPEAFVIDRKVRPDPFPGLSSFGDEDADAALFFGRSREIAETLEELRQMRSRPDRRPFVILGASGTGKSSLLKAGIIPRLRREKPAWLPLRVFRPGVDPLLNFSEALSRTLSDFGKFEGIGWIRDRLAAAWAAAERDTDGQVNEAGLTALGAVLDAEGDALRVAAGRPGATILLSLDQAEEIAREDSPSAEALSDYMRAALATRSSWHLAFTARTDGYQEIQAHRRFSQLSARLYDLRGLPVYRFESIVQQPARRYGVEIEPQLVDELANDAPKDDALPLLAFALQRMWTLYGSTGRLTPAHYEKVGRLSGLMRHSAESALRGLSPTDTAALLGREPSRRAIALARRTFVPALVTVNEQGAFVRRVANWDGLDADAQNLLEAFAQWRLVIRRGALGDGGTVEVAHEALFREWQRLRDWLLPEISSLEVLRSVGSAAAAWDRHERGTAWLDHRSGRLRVARRLLREERYVRLFTDLDRRYLGACVKRARARLRNRSIVLAALCALISLFVVWMENASRPFALAQAAATEMGAFFPPDSPPSRLTIQGKRETAALLALAAIPPDGSIAVVPFAATPCNGRTPQPLNECALWSSGIAARVGEQRPQPIYPDSFMYFELAPERKRFIGLTQSGEVWTFDRDLNAQKALAPISPSHRLMVGDDGDSVYALYANGEVHAVSTSGGDVKSAFSVPGLRWEIAKASPNGDVALLPSIELNEHNMVLWRTNASSGGTAPGNAKEWLELKGHRGAINFLDTSTDGSRALTASEDGTAIVWRLDSENPEGVLDPRDGPLIAATFSRSGDFIVTAGRQGGLELWDARSAKSLSRRTIGGLRYASFTPDSRRVVAMLADGTIVLYNVEERTLREQSHLQSEMPNIVDYWTNDAGTSLVVISGVYTQEQVTFRADLWTIGDKGTWVNRPLVGLLALGARLMPGRSAEEILVFDPFSGIMSFSLADRSHADGMESRRQMCGGALGGKEWVIPPGVREAYAGILKGLPANVCEWRGLGEIRGWYQMMNRWRYLLTGVDVHR